MNEYEMRIGQLHGEKGGKEVEKDELRDKIQKLEEEIDLRETYIIQFQGDIVKLKDQLNEGE